MREYVEWEQDGGRARVRIHRRVMAGLEREQAAEFSGVVYGSVSPEEVVIEDYEIGEGDGHSLEPVGRFRVGGGPAISEPFAGRQCASGAQSCADGAPDALDVVNEERSAGPVTILFDRWPEGLQLRDMYVRPPEPAGLPAVGPAAEGRHRVHFRAGESSARRDAEAEDRSPRRFLWPAVAIVAGLILGAGVYLLMNRDTRRTPRGGEAVRERPVDPMPVPPPVEEAKAPAAPAKTAPPAESEADRSIEPAKPLSRADKAEVQKQVKETLGRWTESLVRGDVDGHASYYGESVAPYFTKARVSRDQVEAEIRRMLKRYGPLTTYKVSDVTVAPIDANHAIANFRKHWSTEGRKFAGEEREQLKFARENGQWRIVSEQELKVYWVRRK